ncbi:MAG: Lrp/AsnC ligand binding domain-containing protein [Nitrososphaerales archaeon]|nr:Lrp/AsnC ligand binding domain-containing protein [Nitrososphaerales archaeon]
MVSACVLIRSEKGRSGEVLNRLKQLPGIVRAFSSLGRYDIVIQLEAPDYKALGQTVLRMGSISGVVFTETLVEVER